MSASSLPSSSAESAEQRDGSSSARRRGSSFFQPADLADPRLAPLVLRLAMPSVAGLSIHALHHVINGIFVGLVGADAVAAVSLSFPIFLLVSAVGHGLGTGCAASIGRQLGAGKTEDAGMTATLGLGLAGLSGMACSVILLLSLKPLLLFFGASPAILPLAEDYVSVLAFGCSLMLLQIVCDFVVIAEGNTAFSMWTLILSFTLNIILDPLLIFGLKLGIAGAAFATAVSQLAALGAFTAYFWRRAGRLRIHWRLFRLPPHLLRPVFSVGVPAALTTALTAAAFTLLYQLSGAYGGDSAIAATGIALRVYTLGELPLVGFCIGAQAVLSFAWGAGDPLRILCATRFMLLVTTLFAFAYSLIVLIFACPITAFFTSDPKVLILGMRAISAFHALFGLTGLQLVTLVLLQSLDKGRLAAIVSLAPQGYLLIPLLSVLPRLLGINGVFLSQAAAIAFAAILAAAFLWREARGLNRLAQHASPGSITPLPARGVMTGLEAGQ